MKPNVIEFKDFTFRYKSQQEPTLFDINLAIQEGEKVLILGPSGSGKSTLANCINGLIPFSFAGEMTGQCNVAGIETKQASIFSLSKQVGTVLQDSDAQFVGLSVGEDIAFALENENTPRHQMLDLVQASATIVGMDRFLQHVPYELSGGQKQKASLAGVLNDSVNILIFDEPLASLDPQSGSQTVDLIDRIHKEQHKTILIIEHRLEDILYREVDRIVVMREGRIVFDGKPNDLLASNQLHAFGIREPLYLTALKYAGCEINVEDNPASIVDMNLDQFKSKLIEHHRIPLGKHQPTIGKEVIHVDEVNFSYDKELVVSQMSLQIRHGEKVAFIGKNGAGKSTMAKLLCGIVRPNDGRIYIQGQDYSVVSIKQIGEKIGYVMQNPNQMLVKDIIREEVELALQLRKKSKEEMDEAVNAALRMCGLFEMRNWPINVVSYGQRKRVTIAAILALQPEVIILDEPTAGQDYHHYTEIMSFLDELNQKYGVTIIFITHDMHLAIEYTDRAIVFADGEIIADDSVFKVLSSDAIITKANLKQTSLYTLATRIGIEPEAFIEHFISFEREEKSREQ